MRLATFCCLLSIVAVTRTEAEDERDANLLQVELGEQITVVFHRIQPSKYGIDYPDFFMLETEVTNAQYKQYLSATTRNKSDTDVLEIIKERRRQHVFSTGDISYSIEDESAIWRNGTYPAGLDDHPVTLVTLDDANAFAEWLNIKRGGEGLIRLPTWNEWMIAAYGKSRAYPWGNEWDLKRLHSSYGFESGSDKKPPPKRTEPVKSRPQGKSPEGIFGLLGNASEFIIEGDATEEDYFNLGSRWMGGGFTDGLAILEDAIERMPPRNDYWGYSHHTSIRKCDLGFRVILDPTKNPELIKRARLFDPKNRAWMIEEVDALSAPKPERKSNN